MAGRYRIPALFAGLALGISPHGAAAAQSVATAPMTWELTAQPLGDALLAVARAAGLEVIFTSEDVRDKRAPALKGSYSADDAIARLLAGSGLVAERDGDTVIVRPVARRAGNDDADIVITGSRIRGAPPASPVISVTSEDIRNAGQADLGETLRSIPQNFNGGQNPGVGGGTRGPDNLNVNGGSSPNLRGLGQDATLTLVNGRRLAYGGVSNAIDISAIPVDAVDRIEVVVDGASALYGSDAVAGVVNVILKRDYDGAALSGRWGGATRGGDFEQQYSAVAGTTWSRGGVVATADWSRNSAILAGQRDYLEGPQETTTIFPRQRAASGLVSMHHAFGESGVSVSADLLYNERRYRTQTPFTVDLPYDVEGSHTRGKSRRFSIAPQLSAEVGGWTLGAGLVYAEDSARLSTIRARGGQPQFDTRICYCNRLTSAELSADGALLRLPGGALRIALGAGYRENRFDQRRQRFYFNGDADPADNIEARQESWYGYGELFVPLVSPAMNLRALDRLSLSAALRYERYPGMGEVVTPKLGMVIEPVPDLRLSASWGKSFKAPTLFQQNYSVETLLLDATDFPAGSTLLYLDGGNRDLEPERSTSWTATATLRPRAIEGFEFTASYFDVDYRRRVTTPIASTTGALTNPLYGAYVTLTPSLAQIDAAIARSASGLLNLTDGDYDPASVVGIVDNRYTNVARQHARGSDFAVRYRADLGPGRTLSLSTAASYVDARRQLFEGTAFEQLSGRVFYSPHWRVRAGAVWEDDGLTLAGWLNRIGGVVDDRTADFAEVPGQTTLDLTLRYRTEPGSHAMSNMEFALTAQNILDDKPSIIRTNSLQHAPFDTTNYSAIGRFLGVSITKRWQ